MLVDRPLLHGLRRTRRRRLLLVFYMTVGYMTVRHLTVWQLTLRLLRLCAGLLAGLVLAAPATTPVPMRLRLTIVRRRPLFCRGLRRFYCHDAYASCGFAFWSIELRFLTWLRCCVALRKYSPDSFGKRSRWDRQLLNS